MKYEKAITKLEQYKELSKEKQVKLLKKILTDEEMLKFQFDNSQNKSPYTGEMLRKLYKAMSTSSVLKNYEAMLDKYGKESFSRTAVVVLHTVLSYALEIHNSMIETYKEELRMNSMNAETRDMKSRIEKYAEHLDSLKSVIQKIIKPTLKTFANSTGLSRNIVFKAFMCLPEANYIQQSRITSATIHLLEEIYGEANHSGFPNRGYGVKWRPLFAELFGFENLPSVAVSILLEGAHHIDKYRESENILAVRDCWDSITKFALDELEKSPDKVRSQMLELYLKKAENLISRRNGRPTDLRVNLTRLPSEFRNMVRTVDFYKNQFDAIGNKVRYANSKAMENQELNNKERSALDNTLETAKVVADVLDGMGD